MGLGDRLGQGMDRLYDRLRDPSVFGIGRDDASAGTFDSLRGHKYGLVVTFRRNGQAVPSPVWMAVDDAGRAYMETGAWSGKVKRIRRDATTLVAASTVRGKPKGPVLRGKARVLPHDEWPHAEATLAGAFGVGRKIYRRFYKVSEETTAYVEVTPEPG